MREIKFRAYIKDLNVIVDVTCIDFELERIWYDTEGIGRSNCDFSDCVLMQYTGLKDKNGTEIYEGYIVKFEDVGEEGYEYKEGFDFTNYASIVFEKGRWQLDNFLDDNSGMLETMNSCHEDFINEFKSFEVIGNIYENPSLLEGRE